MITPLTEPTILVTGATDGIGVFLPLEQTALSAPGSGGRVIWTSQLISPYDRPLRVPIEML